MKFTPVKKKSPSKKIPVRYAGTIVYNKDRGFLLKTNSLIYTIQNSEIVKSNKDGNTIFYSHPTNKHHKKTVQRYMANSVINAKANWKIKALNKAWAMFYDGQKVISYDVVDNSLNVIITKVKHNANP